MTENEKLASKYLTGLGYPVFSSNRDNAVRVLIKYEEELIKSGRLVTAEKYEALAYRWYEEKTKNGAKLDMALELLAEARDTFPCSSPEDQILKYKIELFINEVG